MSRGKQQDFNGADVKRIKLLRTQKDSTSSGSESDDDEPSLVNRKVIIIGDSETGKTSILVRFDQNKFTEAGLSATVGVGYANKVVSVDDGKVKLQIWDTAGQERFRSITKAYYRDAEALLLVFDVTNRRTFENVRGWLTDIGDLAKSDVIVLLLGNKIDAKSHRTVTAEEAQKLAMASGVTYMETSAKDGTNVDEAFYLIARQLKACGGPVGGPKLKDTIHLSKGSSRTNSCAC